jgi:hypothetical protein
LNAEAASQRNLSSLRVIPGHPPQAGDFRAMIHRAAQTSFDNNKATDIVNGNFAKTQQLREGQPPRLSATSYERARCLADTDKRKRPRTLPGLSSAAWPTGDLADAVTTRIGANSVGQRSWPRTENRSVAQTDTHQLSIALVTVVVIEVLRKPETRFITNGRSDVFGLDAMDLDVMGLDVMRPGHRRSGSKGDDTECRQKKLCVRCHGSTSLFGFRGM